MATVSTARMTPATSRGRVGEVPDLARVAFALYLTRLSWTARACCHYFTVEIRVELLAADSCLNWAVYCHLASLPEK